jgi:hypothetical protein
MMSKPTAIDALFTAFGAMYGAQKVGAMWAGTDRAIVLGTWAEALAGFHAKAIERAASSLLHRRDEQGQRIGWPTTLPEFIDLVDEHHRAIARAERDARTAKLTGSAAPESPTIDPDKARAKLAEIQMIIAKHRMPT